MTHMLISAIVHGIAYDIIWRLLDRLPLPEAAALGAVAIGIIWLLRIVFRRPSPTMAVVKNPGKARRYFCY